MRNCREKNHVEQFAATLSVKSALDDWLQHDLESAQEMLRYHSGLHGEESL